MENSQVTRYDPFYLFKITESYWIDTTCLKNLKHYFLKKEKEKRKCSNNNTNNIVNFIINKLLARSKILYIYKQNILQKIVIYIFKYI
jgi:hypothetical protein